MKKTLQNTLKVGAAIALMLSAGAVSAQTAVGGDVTKVSNTVRLIDNKGTIKYLQSNNGITTITNTTKDVTTTTWQLGGTLTNNTNIITGMDDNGVGTEFKITLDNGGTFVLNGITKDNALTAATEIGGTTPTGYTLLVRDEANGQVKKILASDLVSGIREEYDQSGNATDDVAIDVLGLPLLTAGTTMAKLFVFRNGAKLRPTADFTTVAGKVTIKYSATDLPMYDGDVIEIQYIK